jgi:hypothetical protein
MTDQRQPLANDLDLLLRRPITSIPVSFHSSGLRSYRFSSHSAVLNTYKSWRSFLVSLRYEQTGIRTTIDLSTNEFYSVLLNVLIILAHGEPCLQNQYTSSIIIPINEIDIVVPLHGLLARCQPTPLCFLNSHANLVYDIGRRDAIEYEFGKVNGLSSGFPGVGFVSFPFVSDDRCSAVDRAAFRSMVDRRPCLQDFYFNNNLGFHGSYSAFTLDE